MLTINDIIKYMYCYYHGSELNQMISRGPSPKSGKQELGDWVLVISVVPSNIWAVPEIQYHLLLYDL